VQTDDFVRDAQAAAATRDTIAALVALDVVTLPVNSSSGGFTYRLNRSLGTVERLSNSFGPFFVERSLTAGAGQAAVVLSYQSVSFSALDGRRLRDGTLISIASKFRNQPAPFDVETISLRIRADTFTVASSYGITDRLDVGGVVPLVTLHLSGTRTDTYRGSQLQTTAASAATSALGDVAIRAKYTVMHDGGSRRIAVGAETRLPTGKKQDLLGAGKASIKPLFHASVDRGRIASHLEFGYAFGGLSSELDYGGAVTISDPRVTWVGEVLGRHVAQSGRLVEITEPNPRLAGVDTIRLTSSGGGTNRVLAVGGIKWNFAATWLLSGSVIRPLTSAGLNASWIPTLTVDYSFNR
jgi:hypothetical protein